MFLGKASYMRKILLDSNPLNVKVERSKTFSGFVEWFYEDCVQGYYDVLECESSTDDDSILFMVNSHPSKVFHVIGEKGESSKHKYLGYHILRMSQQLLIIFSQLADYHLVAPSSSLFLYCCANGYEVV